MTDERPTPLDQEQGQRRLHARQLRMLFRRDLERLERVPHRLLDGVDGDLRSATRVGRSAPARPIRRAARLEQRLQIVLDRVHGDLGRHLTRRRGAVAVTDRIQSELVGHQKAVFVV